MLQAWKNITATVALCDNIRYLPRPPTKFPDLPRLFKLVRSLVAMWHTAGHLASNTQVELTYLSDNWL